MPDALAQQIHTAFGVHSQQIHYYSFWCRQPTDLVEMFTFTFTVLVKLKL